MSDLSQIPTEQLVAMLAQQQTMPAPPPSPTPSAQTVPAGISGRSMMQVGMPQLGGAYAPELFQGVVSPLLAMYQMGAQALGSSSNPDAALTQFNRSRFGDVPLGETAKGIGAVLPLSLGMQFLPAAGGIMTNTALGAGAGAAAGALTPVEAPTDNFWQQKLNQIKSGGMWGGGTAAALSTLGKVFGPTPQAAALRKEGVTPTIGESAGKPWKTIEEKLTSVPLLGDAIRWAQGQGTVDFNRAIYNRILGPLGMKYEGPAGQRALLEIQSKVGNAYDATLERMTPSPLTKDFVDGVDGLQKALAARPDALKAFNGVLDGEVWQRFTPANTLTPTAVKEADSAIGTAIRDFFSRGNPDQVQAARALEELQSGLRQMAAAANPTQAPTLRAVDKAYAQLVQLQRAADSVKVARAEGIVTPADYLKGIRAGDVSKRNALFSSGKALNEDFALAADKVLSNTYPNSGTPGRLLMAALAGGGATLLPSPAQIGILAGTAPYLPIGRNIAASTQGVLGSIGQVAPYLGLLGGSLAAAR